MGERIREALTFNDILLVPTRSKVLPKDVSLKTKFSRSISLHIPLVSAAMDTVTEAKMAITLATAGGIGVIHKNLTIKEQAEEVIKVKRAESGMILSPFTLKPNDTIRDCRDLMERYGISGVPIVSEDGKLLGIVTKRDLLFETDGNKKLSMVMTKENLVIAFEGITLEEAKRILKEKKIEKLPIVDRKGYLKGLITAKDIIKKLENPHATVDSLGRLRVAGAIGVGKDCEARAEALVSAGVDALVIDTAHAHSEMVIRTTRTLRKKYKEIDIIVGNVATREACWELARLDVDGIKVGIGPGSICTTRVIAGVGVPQITAIIDAYSVLKRFQIPLCADGGIRYSGDIVKALACGADTVMIGNLFAGTDESPGEEILFEGRRYKIYRAMGSIDAMKKGSKDRYFQEEAKKFVPEGIEGRVPYRGKASEVIYQLIGGVKAGFGYCGAKDIKELRRKARFVKITTEGLKESHPHDIIITKEAPNYEPPEWS
uniref:Inosine-5'-monophosphate dehydrogenase n=1 Tax=candidate division WOR-3 bacterium TaxID=2052148 RepID=A0A7C3UNF8_UNCW3